MKLRWILEDLGWSVVESIELGAGALLANAPWNVDAVVAGFFASRPSPRQSSAMYVEIGVALGRGTPVLVVARENRQTPALTSLPRIDASLEDLGTLELKLDLFLEGVRGGVAREHFSKPSFSMKPRAAIPMSTAGQSLERAVEELFSDSGTVMFTEALTSADDGRPDLAFYVEGIENELGLILVEVKRFVPSADVNRRLRDASLQLSNYVTRTSAGLGLLVYEAEKGSVSRRALSPLTIAVPYHALREELSERPLSEVMRRLRNEAIHGS